LSLAAEDRAGPGPRQGLGLILIFLTTACFACITTFSKLAYADGSNPQTLMLLRFIGFAAFILLFQRLRGRPIRFEPGMLLPIFGMACFTLMLSGGYLVAASFIPVGLAAVLLYTAPFVVAAVAVLMGRERMTILKGVTMALAFVGLVMAVGLDLSHLDLRGVVAGLTAAAGLVLVISLGGVWMQRHDPLVLYFFASLLMVVPVGLYLLGTGSFHLPPTRIGLVGVAGATLFFPRRQSSVGPLHAARTADSNGGDPQSRDAHHHRPRRRGTGREARHMATCRGRPRRGGHHGLDGPGSPLPLALEGRSPLYIVGNAANCCSAAQDVAEECQYSGSFLLIPTTA